VQLQLRLDLVNTPTPPPPAAVWEALSGEQQAAVVALLARLITRMLLCEAKEADDAR
jgi:hypothetical protein